MQRVKCWERASREGVRAATLAKRGGEARWPWAAGTDAHLSEARNRAPAADAGASGRMLQGGWDMPLVPGMTHGWHSSRKVMVSFASDMQAAIQRRGRQKQAGDGLLPAPRFSAPSIAPSAAHPAVCLCTVAGAVREAKPPQASAHGGWHAASAGARVAVQATPTTAATPSWNRRGDDHGC